MIDIVEDCFGGSFPNANEGMGIETMLPTEMWGGCEVLDIGCGVGCLTARLWNHGTTILAVDYCQEAIDTAKKMYNLPEVTFKCIDFHNLAERFDIVVSAGTWEHLDNPWDDMTFVFESLLKPDGKFIFSTPNLVNPRGYLWMAFEAIFKLRFDTDIHRLWIGDIHKYAKSKNLKVTLKSTDFSWSSGLRLLKNIKHQTKMNELLEEKQIEHLLLQLSQTLPFETKGELSGFNLICMLEKNSG